LDEKFGTGLHHSVDDTTTMAHADDFLLGGPNSKYMLTRYTLHYKVSFVVRHVFGRATSAAINNNPSTRKKAIEFMPQVNEMI
jgi:hypothetical protein